jgi:hypothetical protein
MTIEEIIERAADQIAEDFEATEEIIRRAVREALNGIAKGEIMVNGTVLKPGEATEWLSALADELEDK